MRTFAFEPLTREQIRDYCQASGDWNRIHWDESFALEAGLPSVIGHGMLSMGLAARAVKELGFPIDRLKSFDAKFKGKALPNDILRAEIDDSDPRNLKIKILNQSNSEILSAVCLFS